MDEDKYGRQEDEKVKDGRTGLMFTLSVRNTTVNKRKECIKAVDQCIKKKRTQVFPAERFENFLVHHRTNNKNGKRGESTPAVSVSMLRLWAAQVVRDDEMLMEVGQTGRR